MEPVLRISGHGALTVTLHGLTAEQASFVASNLQNIIGKRDGVAIRPAFFFMLASVAAPQLVLTGIRRPVEAIRAALSANYASQDPLPEKSSLSLTTYLRSDYKIDCQG